MILFDFKIDWLGFIGEHVSELIGDVAARVIIAEEVCVGYTVESAEVGVSLLDTLDAVTKVDIERHVFENVVFWRAGRCTALTLSAYAHV